MSVKIFPCRFCDEKWMMINDGSLNHLVNPEFMYEKCRDLHEAVNHTKELSKPVVFLKVHAPLFRPK